MVIGTIPAEKNSWGALYKENETFSEHSRKVCKAWVI